MKQPVKVLFASGSDDLIPTAIEHLRALFPGLPLVVVSEFPPGPDCRWIPYHIRRGFRENLALCRASLEGSAVRLSAVILQPRMPYWRMRAVAFALAPWNFLAFNENFGHFMLRPQSAVTMLRHFRWRARNWIVWEFTPGGTIYTFLWRLVHPKAFVRPWFATLARTAGWIGAGKRRWTSASAPQALDTSWAPEGVSVVIPSRNGRDLLERGLPEVIRQIRELGGEAIVSDNGSDDGTARWLAQTYPDVVIALSAGPLSFARAANAGIALARFRYVCLLNNDMTVEGGFFEALREAFGRVPDLFCATAQIFFPAGVRREETGKAVMIPRALRKPGDFPVSCVLPADGEDLSYALYGSGGCSLFEGSRLRALGGFDTRYEPAYVEDLDLGVRGWQRGWPTVFVRGARVLHQHRATTSRYYSEAELDRILEWNYLRFLAQTVRSPVVFERLWGEAIGRLNLLAGQTEPNRAAQAALRNAWRAPLKFAARPRSVLPEDDIIALGSGEIAVFPGRPPGPRPVILIASPYLPFPLSHGGAVRMYNLMSRAARSFDQVLVCFADRLNAPPPEVLDICVEVVAVQRRGSHAQPSTHRPDVVEEFDSPVFHAALRQTVRKWKPGAAQLEFTQMAQYAADCAPARTILVEHDVTIDLLEQMLRGGEDWETRRQLRRWIPFESAAWRQVDRVVTMSEKDRARIRGGTAVTLPNGVDLRRFEPSADSPEPGRLLFIGSFQHLPNIMAIEFFLREVWPLVRDVAKLHIIAGARHDYYLRHYRDRIQVNLDDPGIEIEGFVSDVRPAYRRAELVTAPLLASAGTNIKIMEAMAMGKAIISTSGGVNGLDLVAGKDVLIEDRPEAMAKAIRSLLADPARRVALEKQARATVVERFDWDAIARLQEDLYRSLGGGDYKLPTST